MEFFIRYKDITIREYKKSDISSVHAMLSSPEIYMTTCAIPYMCSRSFAQIWVDSVRKSIKKKTDFEYGIFNSSTGEYIGNIGLIGMNYQNKSADITYMITPQFQRKGYALTAAKLIIAHGFENLGLMRIHGKCMDFNLGSKLVMQKCGFKFEGVGRNEMIKDDRPINLEHYSLLKEEYLALRDKLFIPISARQTVV